MTAIEGAPIPGREPPPPQVVDVDRDYIADIPAEVVIRFGVDCTRFAAALERLAGSFGLAFDAWQRRYIERLFTVPHSSRPAGQRPPHVRPVDWRRRLEVASTLRRRDRRAARKERRK